MLTAEQPELEFTNIWQVLGLVLLFARFISPTCGLVGIFLLKIRQVWYTKKSVLVVYSNV